MLCLRPYKPCDAEQVVRWCADETAFYLWSAGRFDHYPITAQELNAYYDQHRGEEGFFALCAYDENGLAGQVLVRTLDEAKRDVRFGMIIVDPARRGQGMGQKMLTLALRYAFEFLNAARVTLGVFEQNAAARRCYDRLGLAPLDIPGDTLDVHGQTWQLIEMGMTRDSWARRNAQTAQPIHSIQP